MQGAEAAAGFAALRKPLRPDMERPHPSVLEVLQGAVDVAGLGGGDPCAGSMLAAGARGDIMNYANRWGQTCA